MGGSQICLLRFFSLQLTFVELKTMKTSTQVKKFVLFRYFLQMWWLVLSLNVSKKCLKIPEIMHIVESAHLRLFYTYQSQLLTKFQDKRSIWRCVPPGQENVGGMNPLTGEPARGSGLETRG